MSNIKRRTGLLLLIIFIAIISIYALLPHILASLITVSLQGTDLQIDELTVTQVTTDHIEIPHVRFTTANGTTINLKRLSVNYSISQIASGTAESISVQQIDIHLSDKKSDPFKTLSWLHQLLGNDLSTLVPLTSVKINSLEFYDAQGKPLLQAMTTLRRDKKTLKLDMEMQLQNELKGGVTRHLHIIQQQPGQWNLQAIGSGGSKLVNANFQQEQEFPLKVELNTTLKQLKPWSLLFGFPLPEYQATTLATMQLKPDYDKKTIHFKLDAKSQDIREPDLTLQSATAVISGEVSMREEGQVELSTRTDLFMAGLKRNNLSTDTLHFLFDSQLFLTKEGIQGSFVSGLNIEIHNLKQLGILIEYASLKSISEQSFNWSASSDSWQFENNSLRVKKIDALIGNSLKLTEGILDLNHTGWSYPLEGTTSFELSGTVRNMQQGNLQLANNKVQLSGDIMWKTAQSPVSVSTNIQLAAKQISRNTLFADNALLTGKTHLIFNQNTIHASFDKASRLTIYKAKLGTTKVNSLNINLLKKLEMQWNSIDKSLDIESSRLELTHKGLVSKQTTIRPGILTLSFDDWNHIKQHELTGTLSSDSIELVSRGQHFELKNTNSTYTANGVDYTLSGKSTLQLISNRIHFNLSHNVASGRGSVSYQSDTQEIISAIKALKKAPLNWPDKLHLTSGTTSVSGKANWRHTDVFASTTLKFNNISGHLNGTYNGTYFTDLDSSIDLDLLPVFKGKSRFFRIKLMGLSKARRPSTTFHFDDWDDVITPELVDMILGDGIKAVSTKQQLELKKTNATLIVNWPSFTLNGKSRLQQTNSLIHFDLSHNITTGRGAVIYRSDTQGITSSTKAMKRMTQNWPLKLHLVSGSTSFSGKTKWRNIDISSAATLKLNNIGGRYGETYFSGLNSSIDLDLLPIFKGKSRLFRIKLMDIGIPISQFSTTLTIDKASHQRKPVVTLLNTKAKLLSGNVSGNRIKLDLNQHSNIFTLTFKGVDLAELVKLHQLEDLKAIGKLNGMIPIRLGSNGISIANGKASAEKPGGSISYIPQDSSNVLKSASAETELMLDVLRDFQYNQMEAKGQYKPDGQLQMKLGIKGKSPLYDKNRPVHLNLNLDQNILSLLKSIRAINGLNQRLDKAVQKYYKSQQR